MSFNPTDQQRAVIESDEPRIVVVAGAGSGKTATLTARYLRLVLEGVRPRSILCVTYTKKAAAEMKGRIVGELQARGLADAAQEAETGPIQTMHSFYDRVLRENAIAAGIDPEFRAPTASEEASMWSQAVREAALDEPEDAGEAAAYRDLIDRLMTKSTYGKAQNLSATAEALAKNLVDGWRLRGETPAGIRARFPAGSWRGLIDDWLRSALPPDVRVTIAEHPQGSLADDLREYKRVFPRPALAPWIEELAKDRAFRLDEESLAHAATTFALGVWERYLAKLETEGAMDFNLTEARALSLVEEDERVAARLRRQFRHVMVDESQDMNPVQGRLLAAIAPENLLMVGDGQQSIYLFRGADRELFAEGRRPGMFELTQNRRSRREILDFVEHAFGGMWGDEYLRMTALPDLVPEPAIIDADDEDPFASPIAVSRDAGRVVLVRGGDDASVRAVRKFLDEGFRPKEIAVVARSRPNEIAKGLARAGIAHRIIGGNERFYTRLEIRDLANVLDAVADPLNRLAVLAALRSPAVGLSLGSILRLADDSVVGETLGETIGEGFVAENEADERAFALFRAWYDPLVEVADHLPAWEVLGRVLAQSELLPNLARQSDRDQAIANVRKMLALAAESPEVGLSEFARSIREIVQLKFAEGEAALAEESDDLVTVTTIHKAKGLEWDVVIFHDAGRSSWNRSGTVEMEARAPVFGLNLDGKGSYLFRAIAEANKLAEAQEEERIDYVAATRAKRVLALVGSSSRARAKALTKLVTTMPAHRYEVLDLTRPVDSIP